MLPLPCTPHAVHHQHLVVLQPLRAQQCDVQLRVEAEQDLLLRGRRRPAAPQQVPVCETGPKAPPASVAPIRLPFVGFWNARHHQSHP